MNRLTILARINHHLRESFAETGVVRPLGEIVSMVAVDLRAGQLSPDAGAAATGQVIPIEQVAAFVEGELSPAEANQICEAVMVDNGVLAELVAAVRGSQQPTESLPPIPAALAAQLLTMQSDLPRPIDRQPQNGTQADRGLAGDVVIVTPPPPVTTAQIHQSTSENGRVHPSRQPLNRRWKIAGWIAVAASILAILALATREGASQPRGSEIAEHEPTVSDSNRQPSSVPHIDPNPEATELEPRIADIDPPTDDGDSSNAAIPGLPDPPGRQTPPADSIVNRDPTGNNPPVSPENVPTLENEMPRTPSVSAPPQLPALRWKEITGLLAQQDLAGTLPSRQRIGGWKSISAERSESPVGRLVALRTLPLSRAEAELEGGGRIVIAGDSEMQLSRMTRRASAEIDLRHGSVAIIDVPTGTVIHFVHGDRLIASLRWNDRGSAVVHRDAGGVQVHVHHGTIDVNDLPRQDESVAVASDRSATSIDQPKRLPNWVDRPTETIGIPRHILAQIAETDDVVRTLNQRINELASAPRLSVEDQRALATLATWQAAMADAHLFRMIGSRIPAMRMAALQRLVRLPRTDPRFVPIWTNVDRLAANKQRVAQVRRWCEMSRRRLRPNANQLEQMITGLSAQDVAGRAMADFMLRQFYPGGPPFDPTWTGQTQQRAINVWRKRVGLSATGRAAATNDAAGN